MFIEKTKVRQAKRIFLLLAIILLLVFSVFKIVSADLFEALHLDYTPDSGKCPPTVTTIPSSGYMDGAGTHGLLTGSLDDLSIFADADIWWEWGYNGSYDNIVGVQTVSSLDTYTQDITGFNPTETVNFRFVGKNSNGTTYGDGLVLEIQEDAVLGGYRVVANAPLIFTAMVAVALLGVMRFGVGFGSIILGGVAVYIGAALLGGIQDSLRVMWGG